MYEWLEAIGAASAVLGLAVLLAEARQRNMEIDKRGVSN
jgi:hypothetical protein